jgi:hypothetical protein
MTMKISMAALQSGVSVRARSVCKSLDLQLGVCGKCRPACVKYHLDRPFRIAFARDNSLKPIISQPVDDDFLQGESLALGQDVIYGYGRDAPGGRPAWQDEASLKMKMRELLPSFASADADGKARRLMEAFLTGKLGVEVWSDPALDEAVRTHENFDAFSDRTINAPRVKWKAAPGTARLHQWLKGARWNIDQILPLYDLGILAFNNGPLPTKIGDRRLPDANKALHLGDFANGLGLMINGEQYAFVVAESYDYVSCERQYDIGLKFVFYDVFGLDDEDLRRFGPSWSRRANVLGPLTSNEEEGIAAWWRLQHEFGYAPLITRAIVRRRYSVSTDEA